MLDKMTTAIGFNAQALTLRAERQKVIASNIANADTPGYKAVDFNFSQALATARSADQVRLQYRTPSQPSMDANTVDLDVEQAKFADNTVRYEASLRFLNGQIRTILSAITGQS